MAEDYGDGTGLSEVDKGTILMLCLALGMGILAGFWFGCKWYRKKYEKKPETKTTRPKLKQTFSRFSQVDEELTMHNITEQDTEMLQSYSGKDQQTVNIELKTSPIMTARSSTARSSTAKSSSSRSSTETTRASREAARLSTETKKKPYLETDI